MQHIIFYIIYLFNCSLEILIKLIDAPKSQNKKLILLYILKKKADYIMLIQWYHLIFALHEIC